MKKFLIFIFSFLSVFAEAQVLLPVNNYGTEENRIKFREYLGLPRKDTSIMGINLVTNPGADTGQIRYLKDDSTVYVHTGTHWWKVGGGAITPDAWSLTGNPGTSDATNFIGTTDNIPFNIRVNNLKSGRIDHILMNTAFGYRSGINLTTVGNTAYGADALPNAGGFGQGNTAIGQGAMQDNVDGLGNTALGVSALNSITSGDYNVALGSNSLISNNTGNSNISIGHETMQLNTSGQQNVAIGYRSLSKNLSSSNNTSVGYLSLSENTSGQGNIALGVAAGNGNTTGSNNMLLGGNSNVLTNNLTNATAIGYLSAVNQSNSLILGSINGVNFATNDTKVGIGTTTPSEKLHIANGTIRIVTGNQALNKVFTSDANGVGDWQTISDANAWNILGNAGTNPAINFLGTTDDNDLVFKRNNIELGRFTAKGRFDIPTTLNNLYISGGNETFVGGNANTGIGESALSSITAGSFNTALGYNSQGSLTFGISNTSVGYRSLFSGNNANQNTAIGYLASEDVTIGNRNTSIGYAALDGLITGSHNTGLGHNTRTLSTSAINSTAIGSNARVDCDNCLVLGSVNGINSATSSVNVGINTNDPTEIFHVVGTPRFVTGNEANGKVWTSNATGVGDWVDLPSDPNAWSVLGNPGTVDGINFLGTTDNVPLSFRVNDELSGRIDPTLQSTFFGYQSGIVTTGMYNTAYGYQSLNSNVGGSANTAIGNGALFLNISGLNNTAVGTGSLFGNTTGDRNTALGFDALVQNNDGAENTSIGHDNLSQNSDGTGNTSVGFGAMTNNDHGGGNTSVGYESLVGNVDGASNTAIGNAADVLSPALTNATAIGANAAVNQSNSLVLGSINGTNGAVADTKVGIGTTTPDEKFHIVGNLKLENGNEGLNKVAVSDANGVVSFTNFTLKTDFTDVGNVGTGEDDLMTYAIPAGKMATDGDYVEFTMTFIFALNANNKQVKIYYGGTNMYSSTAQPQNSGSMEIKGTIMRTGANSQRITFSESNNTVNFVDYADYKISSETMANAITLKATGEATSNNDIIQKLMIVKFNQAN